MSFCQGWTLNTADVTSIHIHFLDPDRLPSLRSPLPICRRTTRLARFVVDFRKSLSLLQPTISRMKGWNTITLSMRSSVFFWLKLQGWLSWYMARWSSGMWWFIFEGWLEKRQRMSNFRMIPIPFCFHLDIPSAFHFSSMFVELSPHTNILEKDWHHKNTTYWHPTSEVTFQFSIS